MVLGLHFQLARLLVLFALAQRQQFVAAAGFVFDRQRLRDLVFDRLLAQLLRKALLRQLALLGCRLLRHFEFGAHLDLRQLAHVLPVGLVADAVRLVLGQFVFQVGQHGAGAFVQRDLAGVGLHDAAVQIEFAGAQSLQAFRFLQCQFGLFHLGVLLQFGATVDGAHLLLLAPDRLPFFLVVDLVQLLDVLQLHVALVRHQPQGADALAVVVEFIVAQRGRFHLHYGQAEFGQTQLQRRLQAFVQLQTQVGVVGHVADRAAADEFRRQLAHRRLQQLVQLQGADRARHGHEVLGEGRHVLDLDADGKAGRHLQMFGRLQVAKREFDRQRRAAGDQDFGVLVAQQVVQAGEEAFDFVFALRHFGGLVGLQDVGARGGRHAQRLDEDAGQRVHAKIHSQFVVAGNPTIVAQDGGIARRAQGQAAMLAVARLAVVFLLAPRAFYAAKTKHLEHVRLLTGFIDWVAPPLADFSRGAPFIRWRTIQIIPIWAIQARLAPLARSAAA